LLEIAMPRTRRAPGKRPPAPAAAARLAKACDLAFDKEEPLNEAIGFAKALSLMGYGMMGPGGQDDQHAIVTVAHMISDRLETLQQTWRRMFTVVRPKQAK
jgi:hypothetical protein